MYSIEMNRRYGDNFIIYTIINHRFVLLRVREEPHWQGASFHKEIKADRLHLCNYPHSRIDYKQFRLVMGVQA